MSKQSIKEILLEESKKGFVCTLTPFGLQKVSLKEIVEQPVEGLLYDLNRDEVTILTFVEDNPKRVNDFACALVIRELKRQVDELRKHQLTLISLNNNSPYCAVGSELLHIT